MKTRKGFVPNSSSSSFVILKDEEDKARSLGLQFTSVKVLIENLSDLTASGYSFIQEDDNLINALMKYKEDDYISLPIDRDEAYEKGIECLFDLFAGDI